MVPLWLRFAKWKRQNLKRSLPACFLQVKGWGRVERKDGKKKRKGGGDETQEELKLKDPTSHITPITGTFRSQFLQKALAAIPQSLPLSLPRSLCPSLSFSPLSFFHFILRSQWGYYRWGTSFTKFSFSVCECSLLQHQGNCEPVLQYLRSYCNLLEDSKLRSLIRFLLLFVYCLFSYNQTKPNQRLNVH